MKLFWIRFLYAVCFLIFNSRGNYECLYCGARYLKMAYHWAFLNSNNTFTIQSHGQRQQKNLKDSQGWECYVILPLAQQRLEVDLDDGVKVNYLKFEEAVQAIAGLAAKEY